jgi:hypothetical protein
MGPDSGEVPILFRFLSQPALSGTSADQFTDLSKLIRAPDRSQPPRKVIATVGDHIPGLPLGRESFQVPQVALVPRVSMWTKVL